ncbi:MAG: hypothetical protein JXQ93_04830 [Flavobacteriaceae bacterium]
MIDYIKILLKDIDIERLLHLSELEFKFEVFHTGECSKKKTAEYHFCKIVIYESGIVLFTGSIHKLWNSLNNVKAPNFNKKNDYKGFNGNLFSIKDIIQMKNHLQRLFNCGAEQMIFQNIEFGINTTPLFDPQVFIEGLLFHHGKLFEYRFNGYFSQVKHERYFIKIYNKSNHYGMINNTLRIELKVVKTEDIKYTGIKTFADINEINLAKAKNLLLKRFNEVIYYDYSISKKTLTKRQKQTLNKYSNPRYWIGELKPKNRDYNKTQLKKYIVRYSDNLHKQLLLDMDAKFGIINQLSSSIKFGINNSSNIQLNIPKVESRICLITKLDISMQNSNSILLSHTGLNYYYKNNREIFNQVKKVYLSKKWINEGYNKQIREIAHNIRNTRCNRKLKQMRLYPTHQKQLLLFN